jgi:CRP-like cAMP-binding protein
MFLIERGVMDVFYGTTLVATLGPGKAFGEVSLMYNCPRTATVKVRPSPALC